MLFYIAIQCLRYNICSAWFLDIRISTCYTLEYQLAFKVVCVYDDHTTLRVITRSTLIGVKCGSGGEPQRLAKAMSTL